MKPGSTDEVKDVEAQRLHYRAGRKLMHPPMATGMSI
jgi:hypothetical protein